MDFMINDIKIGKVKGYELNPGSHHNIWIGLNAGNIDKELHHTIAIGTDAKPENDYEFVMSTDKGDFIRLDMSTIEYDKMRDYFKKILDSVT